MRNAGLLTILMAVACDSGPPPEDTGLVWPDPTPWQVNDHEGSIVVTRLDTPQNPVVEVFAVFADDIQGYQTAGACVQFGMPCVSQLPDFDEFARLNSENFGPRQSEYTWVGDTLSVGPIQARFELDEDRGVATYYGRDESRPALPQVVRFGGEWAEFDQPAVEFVENFTVTGPVLGVDERLDMSGAERIEFTWESNGRQEIWLWIQGDKTRRVYRLFDDGAFTLDPGTLNLDPTEVVDVGLAAATRKSYDVDGNGLTVLSLAGAGWKGSACGDWLDVPLEGGDPPEEPVIEPFFMGWGFSGIVDEGLRDYREPESGELTSAKLTFTFYDLDFDPMCTIEYDASAARRAEPLITDDDARMFQAYGVGLFNGESTCGPVDEVLYGTTDLRNYVEQFDWGFAFGEMNALEEPLSQAFGEDWESQRVFMYSVYWTQDGLFGDEQGYGYALSLDQCYRGNPGDPLLTPDLDEPLPIAYYFTFPYFIEPVP